MVRWHVTGASVSHDTCCLQPVSGLCQLYPVSPCRYPQLQMFRWILDCVARVFLHTLHLTVTVCWDYANDQCSGRMVQSAAVTVASIFSECHHYTSLTTGCPTILFPLCFLSFARVLEHIQRNFWPLFNSPRNLLHFSHKNFENCFRNSWDNWGQSWLLSFRNWHFAFTQRQKNNSYLKGGNFDFNYLSYF